jgi:type IV pilus assembly protein PilA
MQLRVETTRYQLRAREAKNKMRTQKGFSLIELLIVIAVILIIAAIAIPKLLAARRLANESSAVGSLRTINRAEASMQAAKSVYTSALADLGPLPAGMGYLDQDLADSDQGGANVAKRGYTMSRCPFTGSCNPTNAVVARPPGNPLVDYSWGAEAASPRTGNEAYCTQTNGVIYRDPNAQPGVTQGSAKACASVSPLVPVG